MRKFLDLNENGTFARNFHFFSRAALMEDSIKETFELFIHWVKIIFVLCKPKYKSELRYANLEGKFISVLIAKYERASKPAW